MFSKPFLGVNKIGVLEDTPASDDEWVGLQDFHDRRSRKAVDIIEADTDPCLAPDEGIEKRLVGHEMLYPWNLLKCPPHLRRSPNIPHPDA